MSRLLLALAILLTGCENFTLVGSIHLGGQNPDWETNGEPNTIDDEGPPVDFGHGDGDAPVICWPGAKAAVAEMRRHGYTKEKWVETAEWFTKLEPVKNSLPPCPAE